ncbi:HlyD family secretion protein [Pseudomonas sp. dw_358]|uniref:HlyD family secretion protein n=1 Tax=Pseudomonas sp. dw_358 TaxID=2720083 RepID=UPI001BD5FCE7|nr:HlyD family secretion protein [Pseudomonas sp. dw_358]
MNKATEPATAQPDHPDHVWAPSRPGLLQIAAIAVLTVIAVVVVLYIWRLPPFSDNGPYTDNAYVRGYVTTLAPEVSGRLIAIHVQDYERVHKGQLLAEIDPSTYQASVEQARADVDSAQSDLDNNVQSQATAVATLAARQASLASAMADAQRTQGDLRRAQALVADGGVSVQGRDTNLGSFRTAKASVGEAQANVRVAEASVRSEQVAAKGLAAKVQQAKAALDSANINLARTKIWAPSDGQLGRVEAHVGLLLSSGTTLFSLVSPERWVIADYKEAQTHGIAVGQSAHFSVDAVPGEDFHGVVERIAPATGSEFSAVTSDNGTGNFVKVPQRIGVRVNIPADQHWFDRLRPGMSVEITVDTPGAAQP